MIFKAKQNSSHVWRGITNSSTLIKEARWKINNGRNVNFLNDIWIEDKPLGSFANSQLPEDLLDAKMFEYWQCGRRWKWSLFSNLPSNILLKLASTVLSEEEVSEDSLQWIDGSDEAFTVKKAYKRLSDSSSQEKWPGWSCIRKLGVQQRVRTFMWILSHDKLLSNFNRWRRNLLENPA